jgi:hypothetical protein
MSANRVKKTHYLSNEIDITIGKWNKGKKTISYTSSDSDRSSNFDQDTDTNGDTDMVKINNLNRKSDKKIKIRIGSIRNNRLGSSVNKTNKYEESVESNESDSSNSFSSSDSRIDVSTDIIEKESNIEDNGINNKIVIKKDIISSKKLKRDVHMKLSDLVTKFNTVMMGIMSHIGEYYGDSNNYNNYNNLNIFGIKSIFSEIMNKTPDEPISYFLLNVYKNNEYRRNILKQNDKFFIDQTYDHITSNDEANISKLLGFKQLWKKIDEDTKKFIKKSMMILVKICEKYILTMASLS